MLLQNWLQILCFPYYIFIIVSYALGCIFSTKFDSAIMPVSYFVQICSLYIFMFPGFPIFSFSSCCLYFYIFYVTLREAKS